MRQAIEEFLSFLRLEKNYSRNTLAAYGNDLRQLASRMAASMGPDAGWQRVRPSHLLSYLADLKEKRYAAATEARKVAAIRSFFGFLHGEGAIERDPTDGLKADCVPRSLPRPLSVREVDELLEQATRSDSPEAVRDHAMLDLMYATGLRVSELVALDLGDIDLDQRCVRCVGKGSKERILPVVEDATEAVQRYLGDGRPRLVKSRKESALFVNRRGARLTRQGFWLILKGYARAANIPAVTPHTLRHSIATHLLEGAKMNLRELQEFLGHANIATTQVYTYVSSEHKRKVYDQSHPRAR